LGYFVWKITLLPQKIIFFPILISIRQTVNNTLVISIRQTVNNTLVINIRQTVHNPLVIRVDNSKLYILRSSSANCLIHY
jgi:hypothetical protein